MYRHVLCERKQVAAVIEIVLAEDLAVYQLPMVRSVGLRVTTDESYRIVLLLG